MKDPPLCLHNPLQYSTRDENETPFNTCWSSARVFGWEKPKGFMTFKTKEAQKIFTSTTKTKKWLSKRATEITALGGVGGRESKFLLACFPSHLCV